MAIKNLDEVEATAGQGFGKPSGSPKKSGKSGSAIKVHGQYEQVAEGLSQSGDIRLGTLAHSFIESRKTSVNKFCDLLEKAETGELDLILIAQNMQERRDRRTQESQEFDIASNNPLDGLGLDLEGADDYLSMITGSSTAKAIAGV